MIQTLDRSAFVAPMLGAIANAWNKARPQYIQTHYCSDLGGCPRARWCKYLRVPVTNPTAGEQRLQMAYGEACERVLMAACMAARWRVGDRQRKVWFKLGEKNPKRYGPTVGIFGHIDGTIQHPSLGVIGIEGKWTGPEGYKWILSHGPKTTHLAQCMGYMAGMNAQRWLLCYMTHKVPRGLAADPITGYVLEWDGGLWDHILDDISAVEQGLTDRKPPARTRREWQAWACKPEWCTYFDICFRPGGDEDLVKHAVNFFKNPPAGARVSPCAATGSGGVSGHGPGRAVPEDAAAGKLPAVEESGATAPASEAHGERQDGLASAGPPLPAIVEVDDALDGRR